MFIASSLTGIKHDLKLCIMQSFNSILSLIYISFFMLQLNHGLIWDIGYLIGAGWFLYIGFVPILRRSCRCLFWRKVRMKNKFAENKIFQNAAKQTMEELKDLTEALLVSKRIEDDMSIEIVNRIIEDLKDRRGLRQEWESIDSNIQDEIRDNWVSIVNQVLLEQKNESD